MFDVILHTDPMPAALHSRPKRYFAAVGDAPARGMTRMSEDELRAAIADTDEAWQVFMAAQATEAPALPEVYLRSPGGVTWRLVIDDLGAVKGEAVG